MSARSLDAAKVVIGEACRASAVLHTLLYMFENVCNKKEKALLMLASASENRFVRVREFLSRVMVPTLSTCPMADST